MLADKFYEFLESIYNDISCSSIVDYGKEIYFDGHIPKDKLEEFLSKIEERIEYGRHVIEILADAALAGIEVLPDSEHYKYCWDEMTDSEQEEVKKVRRKLNRALEIYKVFKNK